MFNNKWFLFIEWWLVLVAGIGIFSAALFPSLTSYLARGRDTARMSHLKEISTALETYYVDNTTFPEVDPSGCIPLTPQMKRYFPRNIPIDPTQGKSSTGCDGTNGMTYAYRVFQDADNQQHYAISANMENPNGWNSAQTIDAYTAEDFADPNFYLSRWDGKYYILYR